MPQMFPIFMVMLYLCVSGLLFMVVVRFYFYVFNSCNSMVSSLPESYKNNFKQNW